MVNPLDWSGGLFLLFYVAVALPILLALQRWRARLGPASTSPDIADLGLMEIAYLAGGPERVTDTALVGLFEAEAATLDQIRNLALVDPTVPVPPELLPFRYAGSTGVSRQNFHTWCSQYVDQIRGRLAQRGLVPSDDVIGDFRIGAVSALCVPIALGLSKIVVGAGRDRPVGFLAFALMVTVVWGALLILLPPYRSLGGTQVLAGLRCTHGRAARAPLPNELSLAFALTGCAVLDGRSYEAFFRNGSSGDSGSGDGGSGGGCGGCSA